MAEANYTKTQTFTAEVDLSAYRFVGPSTTANNVTTPAAGGLAMGVLVHDATAEDESIGVVTEAGSKVPIASSAAIAAGAEIAATAIGEAVTAVSTNFILGIALEAATAKDEYITMLYQPQGIKA